MKRLVFRMISVFAVLAILAGCASPAATPAASPVPPTDVPVKPTDVPPTDVPPTDVPPTDVPAPEWTAPEGALVSIKVDTAPTLDGVADEAFWADAPITEIEVAEGMNIGETMVNIQSVYSGDTVYFFVSYADPTLSEQRSPWVLGEDGTWKKLKDPDDKGGDNNVYYEDKFAMQWPINNSVEDFETKGCFTGCHEDDDTGKPYGNKFIKNEGGMADLWHWKSIRNLNQIDDQYVDTMPYDKEKSPEAGRHSDPKDSGGYVDNQTEDKTMPAFALPDNKPAPPYFILDNEKVPFDATKYVAGDEVPGIIKSEIVGDRGNISAGWQYKDGMWMLEFSRKLVTGSEFDVQFDDLTAMYYFGVAVFDNAQVRHAYQNDPSMLVFKP